MNILHTAQTRYSTKNFDASRTIPPQTVQQLKQLLQLAPSSVNAQPWHFIIAHTPQGKQRIAKSTQGFYSFNLNKVLQASHVVIFCAKTELSASYLDQITEQEQTDGRFATPQIRNDQHAGRHTFVNIHQNQLNDLPLWTAKQTYLNLGAFLLGAAALGVDSVPIEGFDSALLDAEFNLPTQQLKSLAIVALGYKDSTDYNASLPKSRLPLSSLITDI